MTDVRWLPEDAPYLDRADLPHVRPNRPYNQGDIFVDVPIASAGRGEDRPKVNSGPVMLMGHPCSIHAGGRVIETQFVASIRPMDEAAKERPFTAPWDTHLYLFPLPQLIAGRDFVVDFRRLGTTHFKNLENRRIACMTSDGWAAVQRRWAWHTLRADLPLDVRSQDLRGLWNELALWEEWTARGNAREGFHAWRDAPQREGPYTETTRADLLDFAFDELWGELPSADVGRQTETTDLAG